MSSIPNVSTPFNDIINSNNLSLSALNSLLSKGTVQTDFWATRRIEVGNDSIEITEIVERFVNYVKTNERNLTESDRKQGLSCIKKMRQFYQVTDEMVQDSNFITRIINLVKAFFNYVFEFFRGKAGRDCIDVTSEDFYSMGPYNIEMALTFRTFDLPVYRDPVIRFPLSTPETRLSDQSESSTEDSDSTSRAASEWRYQSRIDPITNLPLPAQEAIVHWESGPESRALFRGLA